LVAQGVFSDDDEEACVPSSLPGHLRNRGVRKAPVLGGSSARAIAQTEPAAGVSVAALQGQEGSVQEAKKEDDEEEISPLSSTCCGLTPTSSFFSCTLQEGGSAFDSDDDDFFTSGEFHRVSMESPLWIPGEEITVTFTKNNTRETVMWGGRVEKQKTVSSLVRINPPRCQTPLTPINQVIRRSLIAPGSRTLESRLREASIGALFPIQLEWKPEIKEEVVKVVPRPKAPHI
jgi:archaellum component FlaF (FlaF/FlaG flagellin family)